MAKLIVISGEERQEFELAAFNTIGRHPDNTIQILDRIISKEHAQIQRSADGRFLLRDLRSLNGTFMRGERVARPLPRRRRRVHDGLDPHRVRRQAQGRRRAAAGDDRPGPDREPHPRPHPGQHRRLHARAADCATTRSCGATTSACASATSWPARSAASSISTSCCPRSSTRRSSWSAPTAA